jgi:nucleotide-binding universal stress UspA family protein
MKSPAEQTETQRVMVGTDRSETADQAVRWAASFAERYDAELFVAQVISPRNPASTEYGAAERTQAALAGEELAAYASQVAGARGRGLVLIDPDPAAAIIHAAEQENIDMLVVGNLGMAGRKEFLLGNVPNRISHNARCTVVIVNTMPAGDRPSKHSQTFVRGGEPAPTEPRLMARGGQIAAVMARHGLKELFGRPDEEGSTGRRRQAKRLRSALEELGPTFSKLGQILSTRPDLLPAEYIEELEKLQDHVPPLTEREVVGVFERELGVPWEDVFESIEPKPLAAGTIAQVHRATLVGGGRIVVKARLDPTLDPFDIAGHFLMRSMFKGMRSRLDPKALLYQSQKLQVRATRVIDALERLVGARPGPKLEVKFRANTLEDAVRRTGHRVALGLTAAASVLAAGLTAGSAAVAEWIPAGFGVSGAVLTLGLIADAMRRR